MALSFHSLQVSDICLGKPAILWLPLSGTIAVALKAFKNSPNVMEVAVCKCDQSSHLNTYREAKGSSHAEEEECECVGKISMVDVICFLSKYDSLTHPRTALASPISVLLPAIPAQLPRIHPHSSVMRGLDLIVSGAESLILPIPEKRRRSNATKVPPKTIAEGFSTTVHGGKEFCWITHEDVVRFLMGFIGVFSPLPSMSIQDLGLISPDVLQIESEKPASQALHIILTASHTQSAIAVIEPNRAGAPKLIGEISPCTLMSCDETVALALATLTAGDFLSYINCAEPSESLIEAIRQGINHRKAENKQEEDEKTDSASSVSRKVDRVQWTKWSKNDRGYALRGAVSMVTCRPWNTLMAVIMQALANRLNYMWVTDDNCSLIGIVSFWNILDLFCNHLHSIVEERNWGDD